LQLTLEIAEMLANGELALVTTTLAEEVHPLASETITE
jgi:hypothetical protein